MKSFTKKYISQLINTLKKTDIEIFEEIIDALEKVKGKIYIIGNGGSAAIASHMANDLGIGLKRRGIRNFDVESLGDNSSVCTAIANDIGYENIFKMQLKNKITKKDILIAISSSGNSPNIVKAIKYAKKKNATVIGLSGFDGGKLKKLSDISFHVETQKGSYGLVEDMHSIANHIIYSYYIERGALK